MVFVENLNSNFKRILDGVKEEERLGIHSFHRYYGKLIPAIPRAAIRTFTEEGGVVFDPFVGSGTTAVEAAYLNRNFFGVEINPLSVMISKIKTNNYDVATLKRVENRIIELISEDDAPVAEEEKPFCINRDHWFKDFVQDDLIKIKRNIPLAIDIVEENKDIYAEFLLGVLSAIVKQVSNADTMHVFPGISKRMRALEADGKIHIDVFATFKRGLRKRISYVEEFGVHESRVELFNDSSATIDLTEKKETVDLIVTNPPYISSVRYAETLKLELFWMGVCKSSSEYNCLANSMIGNDHIQAKDYCEKHLTEYDFINEYIEKLYQLDAKSAKVLYDYFTLMNKVIKNMCLVLKPGKKVVMKISDSKMRKVKVPTGRLLTQIAELNGFNLVDFFNDKINENSRSLTTARNTYSDIILEDNIIVWEKK